MDRPEIEPALENIESELPQSEFFGALRLVRRVILGVVFCGTSILIVLCGGHFLDRHNTAYAAEVALLDWRDFNDLERAKDRLSWELDAARVGPSVRVDSCMFIENSAGNRVECTWTPQVKVPFLNHSFPIVFRTCAEFGVDGYLKWHPFGVE
jgi:hypothetical protein